MCHVTTQITHHNIELFVTQSLFIVLLLLFFSIMLRNTLMTTVHLPNFYTNKMYKSNGANMYSRHTSFTKLLLDNAERQATVSQWSGIQWNNTIINFIKIAHWVSTTGVCMHNKDTSTHESLWDTPFLRSPTKQKIQL
jgi:membrane-associated PAP2 superfamily phosphatase